VAFTTFFGIGVSAQDAAGGGQQISDAADGSTYLVSIGDPDALDAAGFADIKFDGDESFVLNNQSSVGRFAEQFYNVNFVGEISGAAYADSQGRGRSLPTLYWGSRIGGSNSAQLFFRQLEEVRKTAASAQVTGNITEHVRILELRLSDRRSVQAVGTRSPASALPVAGTATFVGEAAGSFATNAGTRIDFIGDSVINVDFARQGVSGRIIATQFLSNGYRPPLQIDFAATITGQSFTATRVTVTGADILQGGTLVGSFYGPAGDELALTFSTSGASGSVVAGAVAGRE